jgi:uncharacterized protein (TIGR03085 family)
MESLARTERRALAALFLEVGPDAPTLDEGWLTRDLAAHLVVRERRADASAGVVLPPLKRWGERVRLAYAARPWAELVELFRSGPGLFSYMAIPKLDDMFNSGEFFIHHEDVRRARPHWEPRELPAEVQDKLWDILRVSAKLFVKPPCPLTLATPDGRSVHVGGDGQGVTVTGPPAELTLFASGRQAHARVASEGDPSLVAAVAGARFGT